MPSYWQILKELHKSCQKEDGSDDQKKGTQLLEVYAIEIQMYTETKNNKKLKVRHPCLPICCVFLKIVNSIILHLLVLPNYFTLCFFFLVKHNSFQALDAMHLYTELYLIDLFNKRILH